MTTGTMTLQDGQTASVEGYEWQSNHRALLGYLRVRFPITDSPADGWAGSKELIEAAEVLGGTVEWVRHPDDPLTVY